MPKHPITPQSSRSIREIAKRLQNIADELNKAADVMDENTPGVIPMRFYSSMVQGMSWIENFRSEVIACTYQWAENNFGFQANKEEAAKIAWAPVEEKRPTRGRPSKKRK